MKYIIPVSVFFLMVLPMSVNAQGLVPCDGVNCNACHVTILANNVMNFLITLLTILGVIMLVYAGFLMVTSGGNENGWTRAKSVLTNVIIGIILVLAAWLIVDTILKGLTGSGLEVWSVIECSDRDAAALDDTTRRPGDPVASGQLTENEARDALTAAGIGVNKDCASGTCLEGINASTINEAIYLKQSCGCDVTITGGTESGHAAGTYSHANGYKIDLRRSGGVTDYIQSQGRRVGTRSDGATLYEIPGRSNVEYALEGDHWDITVL